MSHCGFQVICGCTDEEVRKCPYAEPPARGMEAAKAGETEGLDPEGATARSEGRAQKESGNRQSGSGV